MLGRRRWCNGETFTNFFLSVFLQIFKISVIYHRRRRSVHSCCSKNYKTYEFSKISAYFNKNLKTPLNIIKISLKKKNSFSLWWPGDGKHTKTFFSQNLQIFKICVIYHRGFSQSTAQNYINLSSHSFIHCGILQK